MVPEDKGDKFRWILRTGWKGCCPRCGEGRMFTGLLKVAKTCDRCGLDYRFAAPDDGPAFFALCFVAFPLTFVLVWLQIAYEPPFWVHLVVSIPLMLIGCLLPLRPIKGWLVASQYVNRAQEAGTDRLWDQMHGGPEAHEQGSRRRPTSGPSDADRQGDG